MTSIHQRLASEADIVRHGFIAAYQHVWHVDQEYAERLMRHVELGAIEQEVEQARAIRNTAEGEGLYNATYYEGFDDALERVMPNE